MDDERWLTRIRERPDDPAARRGYAEWLERNGDARAEFLRTEERLRETLLGDRSRRELGRVWREARAKQDPAWLARVEPASPVPGWLPIEARRPPVNGLHDWRAWAAESHYEWVILAALAPIEEVVREVMGVGMAISPEAARASGRWVQNVAVGMGQEYETVGPMIPFVQLQGHAWTVAMYRTFDYTISASDAAHAHALALSDRLGTLAATYEAEDTSSAVGYTLFECGEEIEAVEQDGSQIVFRSKRRPPPAATEAKDLDGDLFRALGLYLPGFYAAAGEGVRLDVPGPSRCARADLLRLSFGPEPSFSFEKGGDETAYRSRMAAYPAVHIIRIEEFEGYDPEGEGETDGYDEDDEPF